MLSFVVRAALLGLVVRRLVQGSPKTAHSTSVRSTERISVIVPARNEQDRLPLLLNTLQSAAVDELIVVDDNSTDQTVRIAQSFGARLVTAPPLPQGWVGKPWALQCGLNAATGDIVVCLDADVIANANLVTSVAGELDNVDVVSLTPSPETSSVLDAAIHASLLNTLIYRFGTKPSRPSRIYMNGQCVGFRRQWLQDRGGFALAKANMTDDVALARELARRGARISVLDGRELLSTAMYSSAVETLAEWPRSLPMNDCTPTSIRLYDTLFLWLSIVLPVLRILTRRSDVLDVSFVAARWGTAIGLARIYKSKGALLAPLADVVCLSRLTWTTLRPVKRWRDRLYD